MPLHQAALLVALAVAGWAICGAAIGIGFAVMSVTAALVVHALVAALAFTLLSAVYFTRFPAASPLATAAAFLALVVALDAFVVAPFIERSFAMFASVLGTSVAAQKFARSCGRLGCELLSQSHTSSAMTLVSLLNPKFATVRAAGRLRTSDSGHWISFALIFAVTWMTGNPMARR